MSKLLSGKTRYPSHSLGVFAQDPHLDVGATGQVWAEAVRSAWIGSGGSEVSFEETFPNLAEQAKGPPRRSEVDVNPQAWGTSGCTVRSFLLTRANRFQHRAHTDGL